MSLQVFFLFDLRKNVQKKKQAPNIVDSQSSAVLHRQTHFRWIHRISVLQGQNLRCGRQNTRSYSSIPPQTHLTSLYIPSRSFRPHRWHTGQNNDPRSKALYSNHELAFHDSTHKCLVKVTLKTLLSLGCKSINPHTHTHTHASVRL